MVKSNKQLTKEIAKLNLQYQDYLTAISIIWTIGISFFLLIFSYILVSWTFLQKEIPQLIVLVLILIFFEIIFVAFYLYLNKKKEDLRKEIDNL